MEILRPTPVLEEIAAVLKEKGYFERRFSSEEVESLMDRVLVAVGEWQGLEIDPIDVEVEIRDSKLKVEATVESRYKNHPIWGRMGGRISACLEFENERGSQSSLLNTNLRLLESTIPVADIFPWLFLIRNFSGTRVNRKFVDWIASEVGKRKGEIEVGLHLESDELLVVLQAKIDNHLGRN